MKVSSLITPLLCALVLIAGAEDKPKSKSKDKALAKADPTKVDDGLSSIGALIPEGVKNVKVKIPNFDQGRQTSLITADTMTRINPNELFAERLVIHLYGKVPNENTRVDMKSATYHLGTKVLSSDERSKVARPTFTVEGDTVVYDTQTSSGTMKGNVHMVIHGSVGTSAKPEPKPTTAASTQSPKSTP